MDAGCGNGVPARELAKHCNSIVCVDNSKEMLIFAEKNLANTKNATVFFSDLRELYFEDNVFDAVVSVAAFHHLDSIGRNKSAREFYRVLKNNGRGFVTVWRPEKAKGKKWALIKWGKNKRKYFFPNNESLKKTFVETGFKKVVIREVKNNALIELNK